MSMRKEFVSVMSKIYDTDDRLVTILGDIGVFGFQNLAQKYSGRILNIGILEQSMVSFAAGISKGGLIPVVHTIAPFLVERAYEQLKIDFGYQKLAGNFVSVGASYDYAALGCTHHCPADVQLMKAIPQMQVIVPGTAKEFSELFLDLYGNKSATYFRLSESENSQSIDVEFGKGTVIQEGHLGTVIAIGPTLEIAREAVRDRDYTLIYYTTLAPFDGATLRETLRGRNILVIEPFYAGTLYYEITQALRGIPIMLESIGVPHAFLEHYGHKIDHDREIGFTVESIQARLAAMIHGVHLKPLNHSTSDSKDLII